MQQTILITGANRGIGFELVRRYLAAGDRVIATCRHANQALALEELAARHTDLSILPLDVTQSDSIQALVATLDQTPVDILINNAGILSATNPALTGADEDPVQTFGQIDPAAWMKVLEVNAIAPVMISQALLPLLRRGKARKIAMISSKDGSITHMDRDIPLAYGTSKAALNAATRILASSLQEEGFIVVTLNPGWTRTDMGGPRATLAPKESAARLYNIINSLTPAHTGCFIRHTGEPVAW